jgi:hypothetical protein
MLEKFVKVNFWRQFLDVRSICKGKTLEVVCEVRSISEGKMLEVVPRC